MEFQISMQYNDICCN